VLERDRRLFGFETKNCVCCHTVPFIGIPTEDMQRPLGRLWKCDRYRQGGQMRCHPDGIQHLFTWVCWNVGSSHHHTEEEQLETDWDFSHCWAV
jgi:hypothetical protein